MTVVGAIADSSVDDSEATGVGVAMPLVCWMREPVTLTSSNTSPSAARADCVTASAAATAAQTAAARVALLVFFMRTSSRLYWLWVRRNLH